MPGVLREGDYVELIPLWRSKRKRGFVVKLTAGGRLSTNYGDIKFDDIIGLIAGSVVESSIGYPFLVLKPTLYSKIKNSRDFKFVTQIIYPRDWGLIISFSNIRSGSRVVEIGTGSGAFTLFLSSIVGSEGHIWSYEIDKERLAVAKRNLERLSVYDNFTLKLYEEGKGIEEREVDAVFIDIPEPWRVIEESWLALAPSGFLIVYVPTFNQLKKVIYKVIKSGFDDIKVVEGFTREIQWKPYAIRPEMESYVFSAYILFSRKTFFVPRRLVEDLRETP